MKPKEKNKKISQLTKIIHERKRREEEVKKRGGNKFQQLEARLTNNETQKLVSDPVIYAIQTISEFDQAKDFVQGYAQHIKQHPEKYPSRIKDPQKYATYDIDTAVQLHFRSKKTHQFWNKVLYEK